MLPSGLRSNQGEPLRQSDSTLRPKKYCVVKSLDVSAAQTLSGVLAMCAMFALTSLDAQRYESLFGSGSSQYCRPTDSLLVENDETTRDIAADRVSKLINTDKIDMLAALLSRNYS